MKSGRLVKLLLGLWVAGLLVMLCSAASAAFWLAARAVLEHASDGVDFRANQIAIVGNDGNVWLASERQNGLQPVTGDRRGYRFPTWSPDGKKLAFIGFDDQDRPTLYVTTGARRQPTIVYNDPSSAPFYVYWSPDGRSISFLTQEATSLSMRLADAENPQAGRVLGAGSPFYWVWSPKGDWLFMHVGEASASSSESHLSFLENRAGASRVKLNLAPGNFQAPLWSADGQYAFYIAAEDGENEAIFRIDVETDEQTFIAGLGGPAYMTLSPDDSHIAYLELQSRGRFPAVGTAYVVDASGGEPHTVLEDWVAAMYWSPDGTKIALLTPVPDDDGATARAHGHSQVPLWNRYRWWIYDVRADTQTLLTSFVPTPQFLETIPYFDQYHLSLTFWSPDSRYFVIPKQDVDMLGGTVWVLDTLGQESPRQVGDGTFAVWSWQ
jgi:TolB protein